jgi:hypothetical protein
MLLRHTILIKVFGFVAVLLVTKAAIHYLELDFVAISPLVTAFVGGVIFIIAIILSGTLSDYKESEKIPSELAASILILYKDVRMASTDNEKISTMRDRIRKLLSTINSNFKSNVWKQTDVNLAMDEIDKILYLSRTKERLHNLS